MVDAYINDMYKKNTISALLLIFLSNVGLAQGLHFESGNYQNTLIELYTSEGCSSCPPADEWLSTLQHHPKLFSEIVPMAFHVDYWDYIGWQDEFAKHDYTRRQRRHYLQGNISQVYTPGMIKNGKEDRSWRYKKSGVLVDKKVGKLSVDVLDDMVYINFKPQQKSAVLVANVALLGSGFENSITAGENARRVLKHDFVVLKHVQESSSGNRWSIKLPHSSKPAKRFALAVWISPQDSLKPIQVIASWL